MRHQSRHRVLPCLQQQACKPFLNIQSMCFSPCCGTPAGNAYQLRSTPPFVQVVQSKILNESMERKLRGNSQYLANLEARLQHEIVKAAPLLGSNLDALPTAQLQQLVAAQEDALKRARSMLVTSLVRPCPCAAVRYHCCSTCCDRTM